MHFVVSLVVLCRFIPTVHTGCPCSVGFSCVAGGCMMSRARGAKTFSVGRQPESTYIEVRNSIVAGLLSPCPLHALPSVHFCAARGEDHTRCCKANHLPPVCNVFCDQFLTCGTDGTVLTWTKDSLMKDAFIDSVNVADSTHACIVSKGNVVYFGYTTTDLLTGTEKKSIGKASRDDLENVSGLLTFSLEPTTLDVSSNYIVAGASDFTIKSKQLDSTDGYTRTEANGEILCVRIDPLEEVFAYSSSDGSVGVYKLNGGEKLVLHEKVFESFGSLDIENSRVEISWSRSGDQLYVPSTGCVKALDRSGWTMNTPFASDDTHMDVFSLTCISRCGRYMASSTLSGKIIVWEIASRTVVGSHQYMRLSQGKNIICSIMFAPFDHRTLIIADGNEGMCLLSEVIPPNAHNVVLADETDERNTITMDSDEDSVNLTTKKRRNELLYDEADDDDMASIDVVDQEKDTMVDEEQYTNMSADIGAIKKRFGFNSEGCQPLEDFGFTPMEAPEGNHSLGPTDFSSMNKPAVKIVEYDPPLQPSQFVSGSSPKHLSQRFLKWNACGVVKSFSHEEEHNIEIAWHDASIHADFTIDNSSTNFSLADISNHAVILASSPTDRSEKSSLLVIHVDSWDPISERWTTELPDKENAVDVLVTDKMVAVITDLRQARVFTLAGTQRQIISLQGSILTCAAYGSRLAVCSVVGGAYFEEGRKEKKAQYTYSVASYELGRSCWFRSDSVITECLATSPASRIEWMAFTTQGLLVTMDSRYTLRIRSPSAMWMPIMDGQKEVNTKTDAVWPIAVVDNRQAQIRYIHCKGTRHPSPTAKLAPTIVPWSLPFCVHESQKSQLEETLMLNELQQSIAYAHGMKSDVAELSSSHLQTLVKLFALACKSERETRASELASFVNASQGIQVGSIGREHLYKDENEETSRGPERAGLDVERIAPRRVALRKNAVSHTPSPLISSHVSSWTENSHVESNEKEEEGEAVDEREHCVSEDDGKRLDESMLSVQGSAQLSRGTTFARNPFKRAVETPTADVSMSSVFDQLESSFDNPRKRLRDDEPMTQTPAMKQSRLLFGAGGLTPKGKENRTGSTAYSLWLEESESRMRSQFASEDVGDFAKFCQGQFRMLSAAEKKEWKAKAERI